MTGWTSSSLACLGLAALAVACGTSPRETDAGRPDASSSSSSSTLAASAMAGTSSTASSSTSTPGTTSATAASSSSREPGFDCLALASCCEMLAANADTPPALLDGCTSAVDAGGGACAPALEGFQAMHYCVAIDDSGAGSGSG